MSARKKSAAKSKKSSNLGNPKKPTGNRLPDLQPILDAYLDAYAIVHTASHAIHNGDDDDKAVATATLRQGVEAFDAANDLLEGAEMQLHRFREGGKS